MKLVVISDTHNKHNQLKLPEGDVLIHCGDFSGMGRPSEVKNFLNWFRRQPHEHKVFIAGNHDLSFERDPAFKNEMLKEFGELNYLENSEVVIEGIKFWGSPWQPEFHNWAFNYPRGGDFCNQLWNQIPRDTDVVMTHGPMKNILDKCQRTYPSNDNRYPDRAGCEILRHRIEEIGTVKYHLCGHVHEAYGMDYFTLNTICVNASTCNLRYQPINAPVVLEIDHA